MIGKATNVAVQLAQAIALGRHGALSRPHFGQPRGTRATSALERTPIPGHYYPGTEAAFVVVDEPFHVETYLHAAWLSPEAELRQAAIAVVGEYGDVRCVGLLGTLLIDDLFDNPCPTLDEGTRRSAAHALASIGGPAAEAILWRALESDVCPLTVRKAALDGLLDLLTPYGWDAYTFMNSSCVILPNVDRARLLGVRDVLPGHIDDAIAQFDQEVCDETT